jgi:hypothetical protein
MAIMVMLLLLAAACGTTSDNATAMDSEAPQATTAPADFAEESSDETVDDEGGMDVAAAEPPGGDGSAVARDQETEADSDSEAAAEGEDTLGAGGATVNQTAADIGRKLIFTANVHVEVDDVAAASAEATSIIQDLGGFVFGQNTSGGAEPSSELVFKVLPDDFDEALAALGTVGELRNQTVTTDDVTERIVDLESRIQVAELGVARLRTALEGSATLEDYAEIERLLLERESDLEVMRGQLRTLEDQVDLATITLVLTQDRVENIIDLTISSYEGHDEGQSCPGHDGDSVEAGNEITVCFEVLNLGDQTLTEIALTDTVLEIDANTELLPVFGSLDELAPGQTALVAYQLNPERTLRLRTRVTAVPTDGVSAEPTGPTVSTQGEYSLLTFEPDEDPGFGDGFTVAVDILKGLWIGFTVVVGFLIPLLVLLPFLWLLLLGWRAFRRRRPPRAKGPRHGHGPGPGGYQAQPPPPGPIPPPAQVVTPGPDTGDQAGGSGDSAPESS